jgi:hypothetical protein
MKGKSKGHVARYDAYNYVSDFEKKFPKKKVNYKVK